MEISLNSDLNMVHPHHIQSFTDFDRLVNNVKLKIQDNRNLEFINKYYNFIYHLLQEFPILEKHHGYFYMKSKINLDVDIECSIQKSRDEFLKEMQEDQGLNFFVEYRFRVILTSLYPKNLPKNQEFSQKKLDMLIEHFWYFVDYAIHQSQAA